jgi:hypothetical protein
MHRRLGLTTALPVLPCSQSFQKCLDLRSKYIGASLCVPGLMRARPCFASPGLVLTSSSRCSQRLGDNPRDIDRTFKGFTPETVNVRESRGGHRL